LFQFKNKIIIYLIAGPSLNGTKLICRSGADFIWITLIGIFWCRFCPTRSRLNVTMTHQSITLNVNKPQKKIFLSFDIEFNKFTLEEVTIPPYILAKIRFFIHEFCKFYEVFFTLLKNIYYFLYQINKITKKKIFFFIFLF